MVPFFYVKYLFGLVKFSPPLLSIGSHICPYHKVGNNILRLVSLQGTADSQGSWFIGMVCSRPCHTVFFTHSHTFCTYTIPAGMTHAEPCFFICARSREIEVSVTQTSANIPGWPSSPATQASKWPRAWQVNNRPSRVERLRTMYSPVWGRY